jgi:hypothetical protein
MQEMMARLKQAGPGQLRVAKKLLSTDADEVQRGGRKRRALPAVTPSTPQPAYPKLATLS